jgi:hypothetical protein
MRYKLLKDILDFKAGTILTMVNGEAHMGWKEFGYDIPLFIIKRNPLWFLPLD